MVCTTCCSARAPSLDPRVSSRDLLCKSEARACLFLPCCSDEGGLASHIWRDSDICWLGIVMGGGGLKREERREREGGTENDTGGTERCRERFGEREANTEGGHKRTKTVNNEHAWSCCMRC